MREVMVNANPDNYLDYFGHLPVFLKNHRQQEGKDES
jgi:hypothetical protein